MSRRAGRRPLSPKCACHAASITVDDRRVLIVELSCPEHREFEGRPVQEHPECDGLVALLIEQRLGS
jgi:hypothetical protein